MEQKAPARSEVIMAGVGGRGVLMAGLLLAHAGMAKYKHVVWSPGYAESMRGGPCECTVILSNEEIVSPLLSQAEAVIIIDASQAKPFEERVKPGGLMIVESAGLEKASQLLGKIEREDIKALEIPGIETAAHLGNIQAANFILLGAYLEATKALPLEIIEAELDKRLAGGRGETLLAINKHALREGARLVANPKKTKTEKGRPRAEDRKRRVVTNGF